MNAATTEDPAHLASTEAPDVLICSRDAREDLRLTAWLARSETRGRALRVLSVDDPDHAALVARAVADEGAVRVVVAGGDGTVNGVVNGLVEADRSPALAILPMGTANDAALGLGIPTDPIAMMNALEAGAVRARPIDAARCNDRWYLNVATVGPAAALTRDTPRPLKQLLGSVAYVAYGLAHLGDLQAFHARVDAPGLRWEGQALGIYVGNGEYAGGAFRVCPDARMDDGALDVVIVPAMDLGNLLALLGDAAVRGDARLHDLVECHRFPAVRIEVDGDTAANLDGEPVEARCLHMSVRAAALSVLVPVTPDP